VAEVTKNFAEIYRKCPHRLAENQIRLFWMADEHVWLSDTGGSLRKNLQYLRTQMLPHVLTQRTLRTESKNRLCDYNRFIQRH